MSTNTSTIRTINRIIPITMKTMASGEMATIKPPGDLSVDSGAILSLVSSALPSEFGSDVALQLGVSPETGVVKVGVGDKGVDIASDEVDSIGREGPDAVSGMV